MIISRCSFIIAMVFAIAFSKVPLFARNWKDKTGKFTVEAEFQGLEFDVVSLKKADGSVLNISIDKLSDEDQKLVRTLTKTSEKAESPFLASSEAEIVKPLSESAGKSLVTIVSEGVGESPEDALKDAFRNAVRQVVGAVVDAETLIKDDAIIEDKIITYSNGFIKTYEEIPESKKFRGSIYRVKIQAQVERESVIAKIKTIKTSAKTFDGKALYAEAVTKLEQEKTASELISKELEGFPHSLLTARVVGDPKLIEKDEKTVTLRAKVSLSVNQTAYYAFSNGLISKLNKMARNYKDYSPRYETNEDGVMISTDKRGHRGVMASNSSISGDERVARSHPISVQSLPQLDKILLHVFYRKNPKTDTISARCFELDTTLGNVLVKGIGTDKVNAKLVLADHKGDVIAVETINLTLRKKIESTAKGCFMKPVMQIVSSEHRYERITPYEFEIFPAFVCDFGPVQEFQHEHDIKLLHSELKLVKTIACEIVND